MFSNGQEAPRLSTFTRGWSEALTFADVAALLKSELGLPASFNLIPVSVYREELQKLEMPEEVVDFYISIAHSIEAQEFSNVSDKLERLLGRRRKTIREYVAGFREAAVSQA